MEDTTARDPIYFSLTPNQMKLLFSRVSMSINSSCLVLIASSLISIHGLPRISNSLAPNASSFQNSLCSNFHILQQTPRSRHQARVDANESQPVGLVETYCNSHSPEAQVVTFEYKCVLVHYILADINNTGTQYPSLSVQICQ